MKIEEKNIFWQSPNGNVIIGFCQFQIARYHICKKIKYILEDGSEKKDWVLVIAFREFYEAVNYAKKIFDKPMIRDFREEDEYADQ